MQACRPWSLNCMDIGVTTLSSLPLNGPVESSPVLNLERSLGNETPAGAMFEEAGFESLLAELEAAGSLSVPFPSADTTETPLHGGPRFGGPERVRAARSAARGAVPGWDSESESPVIPHQFDPNCCLPWAPVPVAAAPTQPPMRLQISLTGAAAPAVTADPVGGGASAITADSGLAISGATAEIFVPASLTASAGVPDVAFRAPDVALAVRSAYLSADGAADAISDVIDDSGGGQDRRGSRGGEELPHFHPLAPDGSDRSEPLRPDDRQTAMTLPVGQGGPGGTLVEPPAVLPSAGVLDPAGSGATVAAATSHPTSVPQTQDPVPGHSPGPFRASDLPLRPNEIPQVPGPPALTFHLRPTEPPAAPGPAEPTPAGKAANFANQVAPGTNLEIASGERSAAPGSETRPLRAGGDATGVQLIPDSQSAHARGGGTGTETDARQDPPGSGQQAAEPPARSFPVAESAVESASPSRSPASERESGPSIPQPLDSSPVEKVEQARRASGQLKSGQVKQVRLELGPQSQDLSLTFRERGGQVEIAVHSPDRAIRQTLQSEVSDLVGQLERAGYEVDLGAGRQAAGEEVPHGRPAEGGGSLDPFADSRRRDAQGDQQSRQRRRQPPRSEGWKQILEETQWRIQ